jgi:hypothetical protein
LNFLLEINGLEKLKQESKGIEEEKENKGENE